MVLRGHILCLTFLKEQLEIVKHRNFKIRVPVYFRLVFDERVHTMLSSPGHYWYLGYIVSGHMPVSGM